MFRLEGLDHIALAVRDVERSVAWYQEMLGLERRFEEVWGSYPAVVGVGTTSLALFPVQSENPAPPPGRGVLAMRHFAFRVDKVNFAAAIKAMEERGQVVEFQDHVVARSIYFFDPDGHQIEVTTYDL